MTYRAFCPNIFVHQSRNYSKSRILVYFISLSSIFKGYNLLWLIFISEIFIDLLWEWFCINILSEGNLPAGVYMERGEAISFNINTLRVQEMIYIVKWVLPHQYAWTSIKPISYYFSKQCCQGLPFYFVS